MDEYFTAVREIEERLIRFESSGALAAVAGVGKPIGIPADYAEHIRLMSRHDDPRVPSRPHANLHDDVRQRRQQPQLCADRRA